MGSEAPRRLHDDWRRLASIFVGAFVAVTWFAGAIVVRAWPLALAGGVAAAITGIWVQRRELARRGALVPIERTHEATRILAFCKVRFEHDGGTVVGWSFAPGGLRDHLVVIDQTNARRWALVHESSIVSRDEARARPLTSTWVAFAASRASPMIEPAVFDQIAAAIPPEHARELQHAAAERDVARRRWHDEAALIAQGDVGAIARTRTRIETDAETRGEFVHWARTTLRWREREALQPLEFWRDAIWQRRRGLTMLATVVSLVLLVPLGALIGWVALDDVVRGALGGVVLALAIGLLAGTR